MIIDIFKDPVPYIVIKDFFPTQINKNIINEVILNESKFSDATIGKGLDKTYRSNMVAYYDIMYDNDRSKSFLLSAIDGKFGLDKDFRELLSSSPYPMCDFPLTNYHETQVSRYGNQEHYDWHIDRMDNITRHITCVYYFFKEPKTWSGGYLHLSDAPIMQKQLIGKYAKTISIEPENNMAIIFSSTDSHRVEKTISTDIFEDGRFSANIWIGNK
jgi:SM-20-related protein